MKRNRIFSAAVCLFCFLCGQPVLAGSDAGTLGGGARAGYQWFAEGEVEGLETSLDPCGVFGINALYFPIKNFSVEVAGEYMKTKLNVGGPEVGDLTSVAGLLTLRFQPTLGERFMPYIGGGAGYYWNEFDSISVYIARRWQPRGFTPMDVDLKDDFGYHACAGFDYPIDKELIKGAALNMEGRYTWRKTQEEHLANPSDIQLDGFILSAGFKYFLK